MTTMHKNISIEDVNAILADSAFLLESTSSRKRKASIKPKSSTAQKLKSKSSKSSKKPSPKSLINPNNTTEDKTNADIRLSQFIKGNRSTEIDGYEHYYDPEEGRPYTLEEIGNVMGVTRERIRQIEEHALRKLWRYFDIMSKREGMKQTDWMEILNASHKEEDTVYMP